MSAPGTEAEPAVGLVAPDVADEFPALRLRYLELAARPGRSSRGVKHRLKDMSSRFRGPQAVAMRQEPIPWAYRVFYRHIGLDPDADRTPVEEAAVQRLIQGAFRSRNRLDDALLIALVETGVPIWALDAATVDGKLSHQAHGDGRSGSAATSARPRWCRAGSSSPTSARRSRCCSATSRPATA